MSVPVGDPHGVAPASVPHGGTEPTEEEAAAILVAIQVGLSQAGGSPSGGEPPRWKFSGRWWTKPVPSRRRRPW